MNETGLTKLDERTTFTRMTTRMIAIGLIAATGGCVNVTAPDKPIEINLNISVTQEVALRLDDQAKSVIQQNPGIF